MPVQTSTVVLEVVSHSNLKVIAPICEDGL
jgi:hypothetical protein